MVVAESDIVDGIMRDSGVIERELCITARGNGHGQDRSISMELTEITHY